MENIIEKSEEELKDLYKELDKIAEYNQEKVLNAFRKYRISERHFAPTNGYGYGDAGRDTLYKVVAEIFGAEDGIITPYIACGSHALSLTLFALLRHAGQKMLSITGKPYDTLLEVINGVEGEDIGSLKDYGIIYEQIDLNDNKIDYVAIENALKNGKYDLIYLQRSRGYAWRDALSIAEIKKVCDLVREYDKEVVIMIDNCYGEFSEMLEPVQVGVDVQVGALQKNCGGGIAQNGGYIVGKHKIIEAVGRRLFSPSLGLEVGSYAYGYRDFYHGLFMAPHTTKQAQMGCLLMAKTFSKLGYKAFPDCTYTPRDIVASIELGSREKLIKLCQILQSYSPVDSFVTPEPCQMPGYPNEVIMSAGTFISGATIELSCDAPVRPPYILYVQGGLTYEHIKIVLRQFIKALQNE